jgi:hypothetical protein
MPWGSVIRHGLQLQRPGGAIFHRTRRAQKEASVRYDRFASAAEAIRQAVEQLHSAGRIVLEADEERYADAVIGELYASAACPLTRCKKAVTSVSS